MRFEAERRQARVFRDRPTVDFLPLLRGVRLRTPSGRYAQEDAAEVLWAAMWDTGGIITIIPHRFVRAVGHQPAGMTLPILSFDGRKATHTWYHVLLGLPGLAPIGVRAIAPLDRDPDSARRQITLGRDIVARLAVTCATTVPWGQDTEPGPAAGWSWSYAVPPDPAR